MGERLVCPVCGYKMKRLYIQGYDEVLSKGLFGTLKFKRVRRFKAVGWLCEFCNNVILDGEAYE